MAYVTAANKVHCGRRRNRNNYQVEQLRQPPVVLFNYLQRTLLHIQGCRL